MTRLHKITLALSLFIVAAVSSAWVIKDTANPVEIYTGTNTTPTISAATSGSVTIDAGSNTAVLKVKGHTTQTNDYIQAIDETSNALVFRVESGGNISLSRAAGDPTLEFTRRNGTLSSPTVVANADVLSTISFRGYDGSNSVTGAKIDAVVDGTPGSLDMPSTLRFFTTPDGSNVPVLNGSVSPAGAWVLGASLGTQQHLINGTAFVTRFTRLNNFNTAPPASLTSSNFAPSTGYVNFLGAAASWTIHGVDVTGDGYEMTLINASPPYVMTFQCNSTSEGTAAKRFEWSTTGGARCTTDTTIAFGSSGSVRAIYNSSLGRWLLQGRF